MIYASADPLEEKVGNKYTLVILAAKRARQLKEGAIQLSDVNSQNPLSIALREVAEERIVPLAPPEREEPAEPLPTDAIQAVALLASIGDEDDLELDEEESSGDEQEEALAADDVGAGKDSELEEREEEEEEAGDEDRGFDEE